MKSFRAAGFWLLFLLCFPLYAQEVVREWPAAEIAAWSGGHARNARLADGVLQIETQPGDPIWTGPVFDGFEASPWQVLELTMKSDVSGHGDVFWTGTTQTPYGGFSGEKKTGFEVVGLSEFNSYPI